KQGDIVAMRCVSLRRGQCAAFFAAALSGCLAPRPKHAWPAWHAWRLVSLGERLPCPQPTLGATVSAEVARCARQDYCARPSAVAVGRRPLKLIVSRADAELNS